MGITLARTGALAVRGAGRLPGNAELEGFKRSPQCSPERVRPSGWQDGKREGPIRRGLGLSG